ncbi:hypothetical protein [Mycobacteroides abscessus]|uniref:Uncharacterized protein n=1 Tax=Mycobacteroides abscessus subsp. massiliense TaxID=1962118 RepID=A0A1T8KK36_9MYCO|nr:hypothetical protein [Mycobacteroides abscessus]SKL82830.1 Uncharacterised protein [Mycobacteroides abscessus subsp. massiliense]SKS92272.1 Uncharacterised protein [Mycobacteroides abscessus subsp. massiliense]SKT19801.1 Uncharacterised protein [Mycobacteroides abscessus subsp. massiliense]SKW82234.1 Uncharacterised protein [Mycobacteroides abscessus subsp. massiliense]SLC05954.1 Uncharacterised protein [Mycobacteroides abscessus subsp. massiliense]
MNPEPEERKWVAECQDCPTTKDEEYGHEVKATWEFPRGRDGLKQAERFAVRHRALRGHNVHVLNRLTMTFNLYDNPGLEYLLGLGDAGDNIGIQR